MGDVGQLVVIGALIDWGPGSDYTGRAVAGRCLRTGSARLMEILGGIDPVLDPVPCDVTP